MGSRSAAVSPEPHFYAASSRAFSKEGASSLHHVAGTSSSSSFRPAVEKAPVFEDIELQIKRLQAQLPPIVFDKTEEEEEEEEANEYAGNSPKCTCTFREVVDDEEGTSAARQSTLASAAAPLNIEINIVKDSDEERAEAQARERLKGKKRKKREKAVVVKSIFDLDDDEGGVGGGCGGDNLADSSDDDLESVPDTTSDTKNLLAATGNDLASVLSAPQSNVIAPNFAADGEFIPEMPKTITYEPVVDSDCPAMEFFETNRQQVTEFHIEALHSQFIPCVNGNWSRMGDESATTTTTTSSEQVPLDAEVSVETANRVVPRYNFLVCDKIPKQFGGQTSHDVMICDDDQDDHEATTSVLLRCAAANNNAKLLSFNELNKDNESGKCEARKEEFREWYHTVQVATEENENLTILPYVVID